MKICKILLILSFFALIAGCTDPQLIQIDRIAGSVTPITETGESILDSPAAILIPAQYQAIIRTLGVIVLAAAGGWQEYRRRAAKQMFEQVVAGNENIKHDGDFSIAQNAAQSIETRKEVAKIRNKLSA